VEQIAVAAGLSARRVVGPDLVRRLRARVRLPLVGIGGITPANAHVVAEAGADGVAVISAVCGAADPADAVRALLAAVRAGRAQARES
jgi:thiamine-phosphate pyrophosphorylase